MLHSDETIQVVIVVVFASIQINVFVLNILLNEIQKKLIFLGDFTSFLNEQSNECHRRIIHVNINEVIKFHTIPSR